MCIVVTLTRMYSASASDVGEVAKTWEGKYMALSDTQSLVAMYRYTVIAIAIHT